jgi:hypothetical protein
MPNKSSIMPNKNSIMPNKSSIMPNIIPDTFPNATRIRHSLIHSLMKYEKLKLKEQ